MHKVYLLEMKTYSSITRDHTCIAFDFTLRSLTDVIIWCTGAQAIAIDTVHYHFDNEPYLRGISIFPRKKKRSYGSFTTDIPRTTKYRFALVPHLFVVPMTLVVDPPVCVRSTFGLTSISGGVGRTNHHTSLNSPRGTG